MSIPDPTPLYRFIHVDNLKTCLDGNGMYSPNHSPQNGPVYRTIHNAAVQDQRHITNIPCGTGGTLHDYVPFYFGHHSPMLLNLKTSRVDGYNEGQEPLIYLTSSVQTINNSNARFVFSNGHGLARFTEWFDDLASLDQVDWNMVQQRYWSDTLEDMDRQRRKQAEFLVYRFCDWALIEQIGVINMDMQNKVERILAEYPVGMHKPVNIKREWFYP